MSESGAGAASAGRRMRGGAHPGCVVCASACGNWVSGSQSVDVHVWQGWVVACPAVGERQAQARPAQLLLCPLLNNAG